jgi:serpin B
MDTVLRLPGADAAARYRDLAELLRPPLVPDGYGKGARQLPAYELQIANRLWGQRGLGFLPGFLSSLRASFGAALQEVDFRGAAPAARDAINHWIAQATHNRIRDVMPPGQPQPDTRLVLASAIYFKAGWVDEFAKSQTVVGPFHRSDGTTVQARLMRQHDDFTYGEADGVQLLWMAYRGGELSMLVVLPRAPDGLAAVEAQLDTATLAAWRDAMTRRDVKVTFPRFRFTSSLGLGEPLGALGMQEVFTTRADLTGMTRSEPLFLAQALHKAFVAVDEEGTEAAAATTMITPSAAPGAPEPPQPRVFKADHPFLFLIRHRKTGTILFMGRVWDPTRS